MSAVRASNNVNEETIDMARVELQETTFPGSSDGASTVHDEMVKPVLHLLEPASGKNSFSKRALALDLLLPERFKAFSRPFLVFFISAFIALLSGYFVFNTMYLRNMKVESIQSNELALHTLFDLQQMGNSASCIMFVSTAVNMAPNDAFIESIHPKWGEHSDLKNMMLLGHNPAYGMAAAGMMDTMAKTSCSGKTCANTGFSFSTQMPCMLDKFDGQQFCDYEICDTKKENCFHPKNVYMELKSKTRYCPSEKTISVDALKSKPAINYLITHMVYPDTFSMLAVTVVFALLGFHVASVLLAAVLVVTGAMTHDNAHLAETVNAMGRIDNNASDIFNASVNKNFTSESDAVRVQQVKSV